MSLVKIGHHIKIEIKLYKVCYSCLETVGYRWLIKGKKTVRGWKTSKWWRSFLWWLSSKTHQGKTFTHAWLFFSKLSILNIPIAYVLRHVFCLLTANTSFQSKGSFLCKTFTLACFFKARFLPFDWKTSSQSNFVSKGPLLCIVVGREKRMFETIWGETSHPSIFLSRLCSEKNIWNHISTRISCCWITLKSNSQIWGGKSILFYLQNLVLIFRKTSSNEPKESSRAVLRFSSFLKRQNIL